MFSSAFLNERRIEIGIIVAAASLWLVAVWDLQFLSDDYMLIETWGQRQNPSRWLTGESFHYFRPIASMLWRFDHLLWGMDPRGYYCVSVVMHGACALLVWHLGHRSLPEANRAGLWSALIFLFLPGHIFAVLNISAVSAVLPCSFFYIATIIFYLDGRSGRKGHELVSYCCLILSLMSKEYALTLPILILAWELILSNRSERSMRRFLRICGPYGLVCALYLTWRISSFGHLSSNPIFSSNLDPVNLFNNAAVYVASIFAPWGLEDFKSLFRARPTFLLAVASLSLSVAIVLAWVYRHRIHRYQMIWVLWICIALMPVLRVYSPWNSYLASAGSCMLLASTLSPDFLRFPKARFLRPLLMTICVAYSFFHAQVWQRASDVAVAVTDGVIELSERSPGRIYLANVPGELGGAPVFAGGGNLRSSIRLKGFGPPLSILSVVHQASEAGGLQVSRLEGGLSLRLVGAGDFFRLNTMDVLSRRTIPGRGYSYSDGTSRITVSDLDARGQVVGVSVDLRDEADIDRVVIWDGARIVPLDAAAN